METTTLITKIIESFLPTILLGIIILFNKFGLKENRKTEQTFNLICSVTSFLFMLGYFYILNVYDGYRILMYVLLIFMVILYFIGVTNIISMNKDKCFYYTIMYIDYDENGKKTYTSIKEILIPFNKILNKRDYVLLKTKYDVSPIGSYVLKSGRVK